MIKLSSVYEKCDWCNKDIYYGNAMVTINKNMPPPQNLWVGGGEN